MDEFNRIKGACEPNAHVASVSSGSDDWITINNWDNQSFSALTEAGVCFSKNAYISVFIRARRNERNPTCLDWKKTTPISPETTHFLMVLGDHKSTKNIAIDSIFSTHILCLYNNDDSFPIAALSELHVISFTSATMRFCFIPKKTTQTKFESHKFVGYALLFRTKSKEAY